MKILRVEFVANAFTIVAGFIFLNMSFLLAEISTLIDRNNQTNVSRLLASSMAEEDPVDDSTFSVFDFIINHCPNDSTIDLFSENEFGRLSHGHPRQSELEIRKPPPQA